MIEFSVSFIELFALMGLLQSLLIFVYLSFRAGSILRALAPLAFFLSLAFVFYLDFGHRLFEGELAELEVLRFWAWLIICPLSIIFVFQITQLDKPLEPVSYLIVFIVPLLAVISAYVKDFIPADTEFCYQLLVASGGNECIPIEPWDLLFGLGAALLCLPFLWWKEPVLSSPGNQIAAKEQYWVIVALISLNPLLAGLLLILMLDLISYQHFTEIRTVLGITFVYLASTSLFRVYPQAAQIMVAAKARQDELTDDDQKHIEEIDRLLEFEKIYLEPNYSRFDLARELKIPETSLSKIVNLHYGKNFPSLLNEYRVREAVQLLKETDAPVNIIAGEVGFNSLASFNRVFREIAGQSPSHVRKQKNMIG